MNHLKYLFLGILYLLVNIIYAQEDGIVIENARELYRIGQQTYAFEDSTNSLELDDILKPENQAKFKKLTSDFYKTNGKSTFWYKFVVQNKTDEDIWLRLGQDALLKADFYAPDSTGKYQVRLLGTSRPEINNGFPSNYHVTLLAKYDDQKQKVYYAKINRLFDVPEIFQIATTYMTTKNLQYFDYITAGFVGLILSTLIYNLFLWYSIRERLYLIYVLHLLAVMIFTPATLGFSISEIFRTDWFLENFHVWNNSKYIFQTLFVIYYLNLYLNSKKLYYWNIGLTVFISLLVPLAVLLFGATHLDTISKIYALILLVYNFSLLYTGIYLWWMKGHEEGRYYVFAWSFVMIGVFILIFEYLGIITRTVFSQTATYYGYGLEAVIFALALGSRYTRLKREKEEAQERNLKLIREQNTELERKVKERTLQLEVQNKEIQGQNEEINQQNEELVTIAEQLQDRNDLVNNQFNELSNQNQVIKLAHKKITSSIVYAERIQKAILPQFQRISTMLPQTFILFRPRDVVSGDFYWCSYVRDNQGNRKVVFATGDCTGHGVPGAFMSMAGANLLAQIVNDRKISDPAFILDLLHAGIRDLLQQDENENRDGMDISISTVDWNNKTLEYAGAKRPLYYVQNGEMNQIKGDIYPIGGILQGINRKFTTHKLSFAENPIMAYTFSDGYPDQIGGKENRKFMTKRFRRMLFKASDKSVREQQLYIEQILDKWRGDQRQLDDILVVGMKLS